ncbi:penicillin amidase family protein [Plesiocystis pacifica SIR-1]|uniref:Penicillin amidase family protein n=1 Tax=Plesiocystis pacifica SIR-1 TaxID=391625 RepID=A6GGZ3_9BACT|nr:acylase [Plesiocystis pacifica]EDM74878.1 penicillin amidase family protein [Plesiocystis pacifica SIR-1]
MVAHASAQLFRLGPLALGLALGLTACQAKPAPNAQADASPAEQSTTATAKAEDPERARWEQRAARVEILRDDYGVPHVYGKSDADAVFGLLYAHAEDDFPRIERNYVWAIGRLAEVEGEGALFSDLRVRLYMRPEQAEAAYEQAPEWLRELCVAFADGLNFYLATHPETEPALLTRFEPWMPMYFFEGSIGGDIEQVPLAGIEAFYGQAKAPLPPPDPEPAPEPKGSNGFAIAGSRTASGHAMLLINPHTSFYFRGEAHVVSEEGLDAYGAVTWGQFFIYQGFNAHNGWMHTSTHADFMDEFVEEVVEVEGQLRYRYGEELRPVEVGELSLAYRRGDGSMAERSFPTYRTHHGPITHALPADAGDAAGRWVATKINWDPARALEQSYLRTKTANHAEFRQMMDIRTNSSNNTVYADAEGNIAYYHGNFMPRRDPKHDYQRPVDGSDPSTDWQGLHAVDETITLLNPATGWLQNCNSTPFTAAGAHSPKPADYPAYMAPDAENFRAVHALGLLDDVEGLTLDGLIELAYDPYLPAFEVLLPPLLAAHEGAKDPPQVLAEVIEHLRTWDYRVDAESRAMSVAHGYGMAVLERQAGEPGSRMAKLTAFASEATPAEQLELLAEVAARLEADFGEPAPPWGSINRLQRLPDGSFDDAAPSLPVGLASGRWGALAAFGARPGPATKKLYGYRGNSFVAVVEFGERVRAKSLLAGGQSGDPDSPHFFDQGVRYQQRQFKDVPFTRAQVEAKAVRRYHPGDGSGE